MATDLRVIMPQRPGAMVALCEALAAAGVNLEGAAGDVRRGERWAAVHVLVEDAGRARRAIEEAGFQVDSEREVEVLELENRPGALLEVLRPYTEAGRNVDVLYMAADNRFVIGLEDAREALRGVKVTDARYP